MLPFGSLLLLLRRRLPGVSETQLRLLTLTLVVFGGMAFIAGCSGSSSAAAPAPAPTAPGTGTSQVVVTATAGVVTQSSTFTLVIK